MFTSSNTWIGTIVGTQQLPVDGSGPAAPNAAERVQVAARTSNFGSALGCRSAISQPACGAMYHIACSTANTI
jgi:hypothetical protein